MSGKNEKTETLEKKIVVNEVETTEMVNVEKEAKKPILSAKVKKVLKIAGVAAVGVAGFFLGTKVNGDYETVDYEVINSDEQENTDVE